MKSRSYKNVSAASSLKHSLLLQPIVLRIQRQSPLKSVGLVGTFGDLLRERDALLMLVTAVRALCMPGRPPSQGHVTAPHVAAAAHGVLCCC